MNKFTRRVLFFLFFFSGFASLVYQVVWTRMAFASFGIITPVLSVVLSVFMLGLALGSWAGGCLIVPLANKARCSAAVFYAGAELLIGLGAFAVPKLFAVCERVLLPAGQMDSSSYLLFSALALALSIFPWCVCMGVTFPFMMGYVRELDGRNTESFSFLYMANVLGAMTGTFYTAVVLVEKLGFHGSLWVAAAANFTIAFVSLCMAWEQQGKTKILTASESSTQMPLPETRAGGANMLILFSTGFVAMAMEVVWSRAFVPTLKTQIYSFAMIVFAYLGATFLGSLAYRRDLRRNRVCSMANLISALAITAFLPVLVDDPRIVVEQFWAFDINPVSAILLLFSICPFCALLGYLTPSLIDEFAAGQPRRAGQAYAVNVLGCILGPLAACYLLLPFVSESWALILLGLPFVIFWLVLGRSQSLIRRVSLGLAMGVVLAWAILFSQTFESVLVKQAEHSVVRRDYTASVISFGSGIDDKWLLVNGVGMTKLTPITKFMVHLPLAFHKSPPTSALVICFGMWTTYRSALSWNIDTTVVELVPSVTKAFGFYHADAARVINDSNGHMITDDGRRFLRRTSQKFDVIVIDPPPPVQAAESSLLYSKEFYDLAKQHLKPGGILQMWFAGDNEMETGQAIIRSLCESFPHVRFFPSVDGWGLHMLGSMEPIESLEPRALVARMPVKARQDLLEWNGSKDATAYLSRVITNEYQLSGVLNPYLNIQLTDDQPVNEYYLLRHLRHVWASFSGNLPSAR
jgi:spermidine synthase